MFLICNICVFSDAQIRERYCNDTIPLQNGRLPNAHYCLTYDDFLNNRWVDAGSICVKVKHRKKSLSSGKQEDRFYASNRRLNQALHDDALVVEANSQLFINQRQLYHYVSHFGNDYTRCFAIDSCLVFVGDMRFGDRPYEIVGPYGVTTSLAMNGSMSTPGSMSSSIVPIYYIPSGSKIVHVMQNYIDINKNGVYCFMVTSNSINTTKLNENISEILEGKSPTPIDYSKADIERLNYALKFNQKSLKPVSPYRQW